MSEIYYMRDLTSRKVEIIKKIENRVNLWGKNEGLFEAKVNGEFAKIVLKGLVLRDLEQFIQKNPNKLPLKIKIQAVNSKNGNVYYKLMRDD